MKKLLIASVILSTVVSCSVKVHTKESVCSEILKQRSNLLGCMKTPENMLLIAQTDSLYFKSHCDTLHN